MPQTGINHVERRLLFGDQKHRFILTYRIGYEARDNLRLARAGRPLHHELVNSIDCGNDRLLRAVQAVYVG